MAKACCIILWKYKINLSHCNIDMMVETKHVFFIQCYINRGNLTRQRSLECLFVFFFPIRDLFLCLRLAVGKFDQIITMPFMNKTLLGFYAVITL